MSETKELTISRVGAQGDGVCEMPDGQVFVPFTLAGERVLADVQGANGRLISVVDASADRVAPVCRHFGVCGGCKLQHMRLGSYLAWKREAVAAAFNARGIDADARDPVACKGARRRAVLSARLTASGVLLGYHRESSHELVDLTECPVLHPSIAGALPNLRSLIAPLLPRNGEARLNVTWTGAGLDVSLDEIGPKLTPEVRARIATAASVVSIARFSVGKDTVFEALAPFLQFGRAQAVLPPGSFLQAVAEMEEEMARLIVQAAGKAKTVADLFCGLGAFTFRIAEKAKVFACDSDKEAIAALSAAVRKTSGLKPVEVRVRDLFREPLSAMELKDYECVVFDPPRAGADAQARMIARSKVKTVVGVSCNPATLARDARTLIDGGYKLESVTPIDQFVYSPHIEAVAVFRR